MAPVFNPEVRSEKPAVSPPRAESLPYFPTAAALTATFASLSLLIYGNEALGQILHYSFRFYSPAVFVFQTPHLSLKYYGLFLLTGILANLIAGLKASRIWQLSAEAVLTLFTLAIAGGSLGARLYYAAICWPYYSQHMEQILNASQGGLSIHGCLIGVSLSLFLYTLWKKESPVKYLDFAAILLPLGQAIWRLGNLFNNEAYGGPVTHRALLQQVVPTGFRPWQYAKVDTFQPAFLYEAIWDMALFACLYFGLARALCRKPGLLACLYLAGYSLGRILIESIRTDSITYSGISIPMTVSITCLLAGSAGALLISRKKTQAQKLKT